MNRDQLPPGTREQTVVETAARLIRNPARLLRLWNWKAALMSSVMRGSIFFSVNLLAGFRAAVAALVTDLVFRPFVSGLYAALTECFRLATPGWAATLLVAVFLPAANHIAELLIHRYRGTQKLGASVAASILFSIIAGLFNIFAMRRGVFIVGNGRRSLIDDLKQIPFVVASFLLAAPRFALELAARPMGPGADE